MADRSIDLTDEDLDHFHDTLSVLLKWHEQHEPQAFSIIGSLKEVQTDIPWNVKDLTEVT